MKKEQILPLLIFIFLNVLSPTLFAQTNIGWISLTDVTFEEKKETEDAILSYNHATFGKSITKLAGKEISITGYMIPMDPMGITYVLSRNPNATCFFCGGAGPETVLQLNMKPSAIKRYNTDDRLTFKGILQLNEKDINSLTYVLEKAEEL